MDHEEINVKELRDDVCNLVQQVVPEVVAPAAPLPATPPHPRRAQSTVTSYVDAALACL